MKRKKIAKGCFVSLILSAVLLAIAYYKLPFWGTPPFPVPADATKLRYQASWIPGPGAEDFTKFLVPPATTTAAAEAILRHEHATSAIYELPIEETHTPWAVKVHGRSNWKPPWWFDPHRIENGSVLGLELSQPFRTTVWIDHDKGIVYAYYSD